jgi:hypothetical protein
MKWTEIISAALVGLSLSACSKKSEEAGSEAALEKPPAAAQKNPAVNGALNKVTSDINAKNYDSAVATLAEMKQIPKTEADEAVYRQKVFEAQQALLEKAQTDPKARESYQMLGRIMNGR